MPSLPRLDQSDANAEQQFFAGVRLLADQNPVGAETCFREALRLKPLMAEAHANLGFLLDQRGASAEAEVCYLQSINLNPTLIETLLNLGGLLSVQKRFQDAEVAYRHALALNRRDARVWSNLGVLYAAWKSDAEAEECLRHAMALDGTYDKPRFNLGYVLLRQGRWEEGWACMEARDWSAGLTARLECSRWGGEPLMGKSLLIGYEAGHGDMIQLCRYAALLKKQGARQIALLCHPALKRLFGSLEAVDSVTGFDEPLPPGEWDFWTPPLSIPYHCHTRIDSVPATLPYLRADPALVARWRSILPAGLRVGLVWKGNPRFENDADRSLPSLDLLRPLGSVAGVQLISLQKGAGEDQARCPPTGLRLLELGSYLTDFADAAAVIESLDLVISVDTAVAHLAGALGKPCWVLLPDYMTDWRWLTTRTDSPWYPGVMRLFRQRETGNWTDVVVDVCEALQSWAVTPQATNLNPA